MANYVRVTELDFDQIKTNIKTYLRNQSQFTDFDFEASNLSVLLDILAYNTHYNAVMANMISNEMFLDTALKRSSVVSLAKQISYVPQSRRSAAAIVDVAISNVTSPSSSKNLDAFTLFNSNIDGTNYTFYNTESYTTTGVSGTYTFKNVNLYQGRQLDFYWTVGASPSPADKYVIPNTNVDTSTIKVQIQYQGVGNYTTAWDQATDITDLTSSSLVYFVQENTQGFYEIFFGDDVLGANLRAGDIIRISYLITDGDAANASTSSTIGWTTNSIAGESAGNRIINTISNPSGGSEKEDIESIRFRSLHNYASQGRTVTKNDYANLLLTEIPGAQSVNVWGGENNVPPAYGKKFISIKPKTGYVLTDAEKTRIKNTVLKQRSMVTADHMFVDPTYAYLTFDVDVRYNSTRTNRSSGDIYSLTNTSIINFMNTNLNRFNANFYRSQLEETIMNLDSSILSVNVNFSVQKRIYLPPMTRYAGDETLVFPVKIHPNRLRSTYFYNIIPATDGTGYHLAQLRDVPLSNPPDYNGTGILQAVDLDTGAVLDDNVGTVYYAEGKVVLQAAALLIVQGYPGSFASHNYFYVNIGLQEGDNDVYPGFNEILVLDDSVAETAVGVENGVNINITAVSN